MDLNKLISILQKEVEATNIVNQVKGDTRVYKNLQLRIIEEREKAAAPITREIGKVAYQLSDIDKRQDKMINQLRENQHAMMQHLPQLAIEDPERANQIKKPITLDFEKRFDTEFLSTYGLPSVNELPNIAKEDYETITQKVTKAQNSIGGRKSKTTDTEKRNKLDEDLTKLKEYKKILDAIKSTEIKEIIGEGVGQQRKRAAYKVSKDGSFGKLNINPAELRKNRLCVKDIDGNVVMDNFADNTLIDLLTKRYNPKVKYSPEAKDIFKDLTRFSGLKKSRGSGKQKLLGGAVALVPDTPKDILSRLVLLLGTSRAGNNSLDIRNEIAQLIDIALKKNIITDEGTKRLIFKNNLI